MSLLWISIHGHECEVKNFGRVPDLTLSAEGNSMGDKAYQGRLNNDGLCRNGT
jgi:hypothetical protein